MIIKNNKLRDDFPPLPVDSGLQMTGFLHTALGDSSVFKEDIRFFEYNL